MEVGAELIGQTQAELSEALRAFNVPPYRPRQLYHALYTRRNYHLGAMTEFPKDLRAALQERFAVTRTEIERTFQSSDGTRRYLFRLADGQRIEAVWIPEAHRDTICISTQVGCPLACQFCMTGVLGLKRNLSSGEIVAQAGRMLNDRYGMGVEPERGVNLVFMGMGEPMLNYDNVIKAIRLLCDPQGMNISQRRITVSTAGIVPRIDDLGKEPIRPELAISLSATTNELRNQLMPLNKRWPMEELLAACRRYPLRPRERVTFEYVMLEGINDSDQDARRLPRLLHGIRAKVNLIPHNPAPELPFRSSSEKTILRFQEYLEPRGIPTFIRKPRGQDIDGACGQLAGRTALSSQ
ncbi:MAG: 23S rRNA (adenine(2503)-C(2))-methyltransferase RlmN [Acidobacteria bacterium]|nr:23S rRNA (adenine(2503)-C(2))-methyltransferase RlmN [Acidobacteriota bacterium]